MAENIKNIIDELRKRGLSNGGALGYHSGLMDEAADTIEQLQAEIESLQRQLHNSKLHARESVKALKNERQYREHDEHMIGTEAIKKFTEKFKEHIKSIAGMFTDELGFVVSLTAALDTVDFVCAEMEGELR